MPIQLDYARSSGDRRRWGWAWTIISCVAIALTSISAILGVLLAVDSVTNHGAENAGCLLLILLGIPALVLELLVLLPLCLGAAYASRSHSGIAASVQRRSPLIVGGTSTVLAAAIVAGVNWAGH